MGKLLWAEARLTVELLRHNFPAFAVGIMFVLLSTAFESISSWVWLEILAFTVLYAYVFDLENQISGVAEDNINKKSRPIPSAQMTLDGARMRLRVGIVLHLVSGVWTILVVWPLFCLALLRVYHHGLSWRAWRVAPWSRNAWTKQLFAILALAPNALAICEIAGVHWWSSPATWGAYLVCACYWFFLGHVQDLRDVVGDQQAGRKTLPWLMGEQRARRALAAGLALWSGGWIAFVGLAGSSFLDGLHVVAWMVSFAVLAAVIVWRLLAHPCGTIHRMTYHLYVFYFFSMVSFLVVRAQSQLLVG